ncbi:MAG: sulfate ABC transporter permease subunit CysT [Cyanobacteria bacterium]|nr:sulfate ABC transporter permease subunit CysT [Cyanobacteriota bacterium]
MRGFRFQRRRLAGAIAALPKTIGRSWSWPWAVVITYLLIMLVIPTAAMLLKASTLPIADIWRIATEPIAIAAYEVTFITALVAAGFNGIAGVATAWVLVRYEFPGRRLLDAVIDLPFALPTAVAGLTLATVYSEVGWLGEPLAPFGIKIAFTRWGVGIAMAFISLPFVVRTVEPVLRDIAIEIEESSWCLGAGPWETFRRVMFPQMLPAVLTGVALGFSRAVGEYGSTVIVASNVPFRDLIAPVLIFQRLEQYDYEGATVIGAVMLLVSLALLLMINRLQAWGGRYESRDA